MEKYNKKPEYWEKAKKILGYKPFDGAGSEFIERETRDADK